MLLFWENFDVFWCKIIGVWLCEMLLVVYIMVGMFDDFYFVFVFSYGDMGCCVVEIFCEDDVRYEIVVII